MAKQLGFYFNSAACSACKACQVACQDKNDLPADITWRRVFTYGAGSWVPQGNGVLAPNGLFAYAVSTACMHCQDAPCVEVCPAGAMSKNADGVVLIDADKCIGCRYCEWACPYGAPQFREDLGVMSKCTACEDLLAQGQKPACVDACVMRALDFGDLGELRAKYGGVDTLEPFPAASYTQPAVVITPHPAAQLSGTGTGTILMLEEEL
ncbi:MAG: dimethylsulfoxide reductase subunit B [Anaerolineales bacterium]|nr:dimethylsulfoxide reductase subunit B [Anaerolineales bacterium]